MPSRLKAGIAALSLFALTGAEAARAQDCVSGSEVASLFVYAVPPTMEAVKNSCDGRLKAGGFFSSGGKKLSAKYAALQTETWPKARRALLLLIASQQKKGPKASAAMPGLDPLKLAQSLPDNVARPLVETMIMQQVAEKVKPDQCRTIERIFAAMSPFDPRDTGMLLGTVMPLVGLRDPKVCDE